MLYLYNCISGVDNFNIIDPYAAELLVLTFHSFKARIALAIPASKE